MTAAHRRRTDGRIFRLISEVSLADLTLSEAQQWLVRSIAQEFGFEAAVLLITTADRWDLLLSRRADQKPAWFYGLDLTGTLENAPDPLYWRWIKENIAAQAENLPAHDLDPVNYLDELEELTALSIPLAVSEAVLGYLIVFAAPGEGFSPRERGLLRRVATSAAHTLSNQRLIQQLKDSNADLETSRGQLLRSRNTLRALFDSIPTAIYIVDRKYNLAAVNLTRANQTGRSPKELVGKRCYQVLYGREDLCPDCQVMETLSNGLSSTRTRRQWNAAEESQEWDVSTYPILDEAGQVIQAILLEQDVTEKRRLEATLAQSEKLAAVGELAAGLAHEINNPLTAIIANAQMLQRELPVDDDKQEMVDLIARAGARASQVMGNLLDLARKEQYDFAPTDLNETIREALALLQHEFVARSITPLFEPAQDLPAVKASANHLQGVWVNLLTNAIDALEAGENEVRILTRRQGDEVRVIVADSGAGMPPERLSRIFEPFYTTKAPGRGTGLGLSVCHRVIKQHGGQILVDSQIGKGTQFTVILPAG